MFARNQTGVVCVGALLLFVPACRKGEVDAAACNTRPESFPTSPESPQSAPSAAKGSNAEPRDMVLIPGGTFRMGTDDGFEYEKPVHEVTVASFWMDRREVTVAQFEKFVDATRYVTESEKFGWSGVFDAKRGEWTRSDGATWRHPDGPSSNARADEPVVQVTWNDAVAYCNWAGARLPTEAEFEFAARGGLAHAKYPWGDELRPQGKSVANFWQGEFPKENRNEDGFPARAPVGRFPPNGYGLYDIAGNVWELCADWFDASYYSRSPRENPRGPSTGEERVLRGGSWMCSESYCRGYRCAARGHTSQDSALNNHGFRCVRDP